jgi:MinD-like ATPase involved in chromosome partitioning or flagellar assembly
MKIITFYSFKGGVGRSTTLSNVAYALDQNDKRCHLIDFDIESCGLYAILKRDSFPTNGRIFQNILSASNTDIIEEQLEECLYSIYNSKIKLIPAGIDHDSTRKVNDLMGDEKTKVQVFENVEKTIELLEEKYESDYLLIDSRAGISNMAEPAFTFTDAIVITYRIGIQQFVGIEGLIRWLIKYFTQIGKTDVQFFLLASNIHPDAATSFELSTFVDMINDTRLEEIDRYKIPSDSFPIKNCGVIWQNEELNKKGSMVLFNHPEKEKYKDALDNYLSIAEMLA